MNTSLRGAIVQLEVQDQSTRFARVLRVFTRVAIGQPDDMTVCRLVVSSVGIEESHPVRAMKCTSQGRDGAWRPVYRSALTGELIHIHALREVA